MARHHSIGICHKGKCSHQDSVTWSRRLLAMVHIGISSACSCQSELTPVSARVQLSTMIGMRAVKTGLHGNQLLQTNAPAWVGNVVHRSPFRHALAVLPRRPVASLTSGRNQSNSVDVKWIQSKIYNFIH